MGFINNLKKRISGIKQRAPYILINKENTSRNFDILDLPDNTKGEVKRQEKIWPEDVGEEHPVDFEELEKWAMDDPYSHALVQKHVDFIMGGGIFFKSKDERAKKIIEEFWDTYDGETVTRDWLKKAFGPGNGYLEIGGKEDEMPKGLKVLNSNTIYIKRNPKGKIEEFNQWKGWDFMDGDKPKKIPFKPYQIAHLAVNKSGDCPYGVGLIRPILFATKKKTQLIKDMCMLMSRKANAPIVAYVGTAEEPGDPGAVDSLGTDFEWLNNRHEWAFSADVKLEVLDFGQIGDKFTAPLEVMNQELIFGSQIPAVLMGLANVPEGLAKEQGAMWRFRIKSLQEEVEKQLENKIIRRILDAEGLGNIKVEIVWGKPSTEERNSELEILLRITDQYKYGVISEDLMQQTEERIKRLLEFDLEEESDNMNDNKTKQPRVPPNDLKRPTMNPADKKAEKPPTGKNPVKKKEEPKKKEEEMCTCDIQEMDKAFDKWDEETSLREFVGFNYRKYLEDINRFIDSKEFENRVAKSFKFVPGTEQTVWQRVIISYKLNEILNPEKVEVLKDVLKNNFKLGSSIREIKNDILNKVKPEPLKINIPLKNGKTAERTISPRQRAILMARTETIRASNEGALKNYQKFGISKVRWIAEAGDRVCNYCRGQNGALLNITDAHEMIPAHAGCRCSWSAEIEK